TPLHATSSGKVLLAWADPDMLASLLDGHLERYTERTMADPAGLRAELDDVRARGWASCNEELELGLNSVAAPIFGADGAVVAAVSVSGPSYRLTTEDFERVAGRILAGAGEISSRIGYFPGG
ncbi:MAG: IclR family transcriptional regulator C-terminal domain-containing protein, partial [Pseudonocardia sp.]|nr:IclR family transcriptional regulator C-terminal domain-containing protein [Pseudonocardia sp.]